jgi:hypothetical protein
MEVKPDAGTVAFGQLETYIPLYLRDYNPTESVTGVIITNRELPDMAELMKMRGHDYFIV